MAMNFVFFVILTLLSIGGVFWLAIRVNLRWVPAFWIRIGLLLLVLIGIRVGIGRSDDSEVLPVEVLVLDQSESIDVGQFELVRSFAMSWKAAQPNRHVMIFGEDADYLLSDQWPEIDNVGSVLADVLSEIDTLYGELPGRVLIATDGKLEDIQDVYRQIAKLEAKGHVVEYISLASMVYQNDVFVESVQAPDVVWERDEISLEVNVYSPINIQGQLQVFVNGRLEYDQPIDLVADVIEPFSVEDIEAGTPGLVSLDVVVQVAGDAFLANNYSFASVFVAESPEILLVTKDREAVDDLINDIRNANGIVKVVSPAEFPTSLDALDMYEVVLVHNLLAQDLTLEQMQALNIHILEKGKSLVFLGGLNTYTLGGYSGTIIEPMLPVVLTPPDRMERVPVTFLLVLDRSGSMERDQNSDVSPITLTREAANRALETLRPDDYFGVLTFSGEINWDVEIQQLENSGNLRLAQDSVSQIMAYGGTLMYQALEEAIAELSSRETTEHLHILLMSDGASGDGSPSEFRSLVTIGNWRGITISTIALGAESDPETLSLIAQEGNGRYYQVLNANQLPNVMISETKAVQSENIQEGSTNIVLGINEHPAMEEIYLDAIPRLNAYIALQSKVDRGAEDILISGNFGDPLLSSWQYGLGHVSAWMTDVGEDWMLRVDDWDAQGEFWMGFFKYTLPNPSFGKANVSVGQNGQVLTVLFALRDEKDYAALDAAPQFSIRNNDELLTYPMTKISTQRYVVQIPLLQPGAYQGAIRYYLGGEEEESLVPITINYPAEWRFADPVYRSEDYVVINGNLLASPLTLEQELANSASFEENEKFDWYYPVLFLVLLSWPVEIAIRRWQMPWRRP